MPMPLKRTLEFRLGESYRTSLRGSIEAKSFATTGNNMKEVLWVGSGEVRRLVGNAQHACFDLV